MRAAVLLSVMCVICGLAALFGIPAVYVASKPVAGIAGFATSIVFAAIPPIVVLAWRKYSGRKADAVTTTYVPPNTSFERTCEG